MPPLDEVAEELLLGTQPRMRVLLVDVHCAAEHHHGVGAVRRRPLVRYPLDELVAARGDGLTEHPGPGVAAGGRPRGPASGLLLLRCLLLGLGGLGLLLGLRLIRRRRGRRRGRLGRPRLRDRGRLLAGDRLAADALELEVDDRGRERGERRCQRPRDQVGDHAPDDVVGERDEDRAQQDAEDELDDEEADERRPSTGQPEPLTSCWLRPNESNTPARSSTITGTITAQIVIRKRPGAISSNKPILIAMLARMPAPASRAM